MMMMEGKVEVDQMVALKGEEMVEMIEVVHMLPRVVAMEVLQA